MPWNPLLSNTEITKFLFHQLSRMVKPRQNKEIYACGKKRPNKPFIAVLSGHHNISLFAMMRARDVSFTRVITSLPIGGTIRFITWSRVTWKKICVLSFPKPVPLHIALPECFQYRPVDLRKLTGIVNNKSNGCCNKTS